MAKRFVLPPQIEPMLEQLWQIVTNGALEIAEQAITAVFGQAFRGGKLDAAYIAGEISTDNLPGGGAAPTSQIQHGKATVTMVSGDDTDTQVVTFPVAFPAGSSVDVVVTSRSDDLIADVVDGSETETGFTALMGRRTVGAGTPAVTGLVTWHALATPPPPPSAEVWVADPGFGAFGGLIRLFEDGTSAGATIADASFNSVVSVLQVGGAGSEVWALNQGNNTISRLNPDGTSAGSPISGNGLDVPNSMIKVGLEIWVLNQGSSAVISFFDASGGTVRSPFALTMTGLAGPTGIAWVPTGSMDVWALSLAGSNIGHVQVVTSGGGFTGTTYSGLTAASSDPEGMGVVAGKVWISGYGDSSLYPMNDDGTSAGGPYSDAHLGSAKNLAEIAGAAWVCDNTHSALQVFDTAGTWLSSITNADFVIPFALCVVQP